MKVEEGIGGINSDRNKIKREKKVTFKEAIDKLTIDFTKQPRTPRQQWNGMVSVQNGQPGNLCPVKKDISRVMMK